MSVYGGEGQDEGDTLLRSLFGKGKKKPSDNVPSDDSIRSAHIGDVLFIPGLWETGEDAYLIVERITKLESGYGESRELTGVDGERRASVEWSDQDGLHVSAVLQERPMGLSAVGLDYDTLVAWDEFKSLENNFEYDGHVYFYRNSYEVRYDEGDQGFWLWEFVREDEEGGVSVVKWEGLPFEVYVSIYISPHVVTVYHK